MTEEKSQKRPSRKKKDTVVFTPEKTRIAFFGGAFNRDVLEGIINLKRAGYSIAYGVHDPREMPILKQADIPYYKKTEDVVAGCEIVITSCLSDQVRRLYTKEGGILDSLDPHTYCLDLSFCSPRISRELHSLAALKDIYYVDAPLDALGPDETTIIFAGGEPKPRNELMPLFPYLAHIIQTYDKPGDGQAAIYAAFHSLISSIMEVSTLILRCRKMKLSNENTLKTLSVTKNNSRAYTEYAPKILAHDYAGKTDLWHWFDILASMLQISDSYRVEEAIINAAHWLCVHVMRIGGEHLGLQALEILGEGKEVAEELGLDWKICSNIFDDEEANFGDYEDYEDMGDFGNPDDMDYHDLESVMKEMIEDDNEEQMIDEELEEARKSIIDFIQNHLEDLDSLNCGMPPLDAIKKYSSSMDLEAAGISDDDDEDETDEEIEENLNRLIAELDEIVEQNRREKLNRSNDNDLDEASELDKLHARRAFNYFDNFFSQN